MSSRTGFSPKRAVIERARRQVPLAVVSDARRIAPRGTGVSDCACSLGMFRHHLPRWAQMLAPLHPPSRPDRPGARDTNRRPGADRTDHAAPVQAGLRYGLAANTLTSGFTLLELLLVAVILAAAAAVSIPRMVREAERVTQAGQAQILQDLRRAMDAYLLNYADAIWTNTPIPVNPALPAAGIAYLNPRAPAIAELAVRGQANAGLVAGATAIGGGQYRIAIAFVTDAAGVAVPAGCDAVAPPSCDLQATIWVDQPVQVRGRTNAAAAANIAAMLGPDGGWSGAPDAAGAAQVARIAWASGTGETSPNPAGAQAGIVATRAIYAASSTANFVRQGDTRRITLRNGLVVEGDVNTLASAFGGAGNVVSTNQVQGANVLATAQMASQGTLDVGGAANLQGSAVAQRDMRIVGKTTVEGDFSAGATALQV